MPHPHTRTITRNRSRTRRFTACNRHPSESVTGFCALCLRDRLAGLDSSSPSQVDDKKDVHNNNNNNIIRSRRTRRNVINVNDVASEYSSAAPVLRRSKSVAADKCEALIDTDPRLPPRRKSCDVRTRSTLSDLFVVDDDDGTSSTTNKNSRGGAPSSCLMSLGVSTIAEAVVETKEGGEDVDVLHDVIIENNIVHGYGETEEEEEEEDVKTMKDIIEMEMDNNNNNNNNNNNKKKNLWDAASVFSKKLRKWRQKQKEKKQSRSKLGQLEQFRDRDTRFEVEDNRFGRRSCDTEPRFSIDAHRLSVEDPRISFDEHRASWDGYMIARTIPRLTPMLSSVDNMMLGCGNRATTTTIESLQMHSISEDSGSAGGSAQSVVDSFATNIGSSSSSSTKTVGSGGDDVKSASNARVSPANDVIFQGTKLVITEKELKDWHLNNSVESVSNAPNSTGKTPATNPSNARKTIPSNRWKKVCNLWGQKHKVDDKKNVEGVPDNRVETGISSMNIVRNNSLVKLRNRSTRYSTSDLDSGLLRLYLTPFRNSRRNRSGKNRAPSMVCN